MSTYINGYICENKSLDQCFNIITSIENDRRNYISKQLQVDFLDYLFNHIDKNVINKSPNFKINIDEINYSFQNKIIQSTNSTTNSYYDYRYQFMLIPNNNNVYLINYCSYKYNDFLNTTFFPFKSYSYWNSTDCPDNISQQQWNLRRDVWDHVLGGNRLAIPANVGLLWNPSIHYDINHINYCNDLTQQNEYIKKYYNKQQRIKKHLNNLNYFKELYPIFKDLNYNQIKNQLTNTLLELDQINFN